MSTAAKILLGISIILYTLIVYCVLTDSFVFALIIFVLHSVTMIGFVLIFMKLFQKENDPKNHEFLRQREEEIMQHKELVESLHDKLEEKEKIISEREKNLSSASARISQLETSIDQLEKKSNESNEDFQKRLKIFKEESLLPITDSSPLIPLDMNRTIKEAVSEMSAGLNRARIHVQTAFPDTTVLVKAHPKHIRIMLRNILDNSIKYMKHAGVIVITLSQIEDKCLIVLKDNGEGLNAEETPHVFELNYQGSNRISGNGLGLSQAKVIAEHYQGKISARSAIGNGMGIFIELPAIGGGAEK